MYVHKFESSMKIFRMKYVKFLFIVSIAGIISYACNKKLNQPSLGGLTEQDVANKVGVEGLLIGAYSLLDGVGGSKSDPLGSAASNWMYGSICGSEAYTGSFPGDGNVSIERFQSTSTDFSLESKWATVYDGIQRTNEVLRTMKLATDIPKNDQKRIAAEARFLRAHYHFEAKKMWNHVPFIDETITYAAGNYYVANDSEIWPDIANDLRYAIDNLSPLLSGALLAGQINIRPWHCWQKHICFKKNLLMQNPYWIL